MEFLTSIVGAIGAEIAKYTLVPLGRQIGYLIFYNGNIKNLEKVMKKLDERKITVDRLVDAAERNLRIPAPEMKTWQQNVDGLSGRVEKFLEEMKRNRKCLNDLCPNPKSRYSMSRKAAKIKQEILVVLGEAEKYSQTDLLSPLPALGATFDIKDTEEFESRDLIMKKILEALRDDSLSMISICGLGGVGKTTMVKKLVKIVETRKLFDVVAMAVVSQNPDVRSFQGAIAFRLGLSFHGENEQGRVQKLYERIISKCEEKILLVLDDIWTEMDFKELGIPSPGKRAGYKILLTSRREDECRKMGSSVNFCVDALSNEEGWNLFKGIAFSGDHSIYNEGLMHRNPMNFSPIDARPPELSRVPPTHPLAKQVANECDGLPIAIVTIAKALKARGVPSWDKALHQLRSSDLRGIPGMEKVYSSLELSYNLLEHKEAKACFLLCSLFPEDYAIPIEDLVRYAVGLQLLDNVETISQARSGVYELLRYLKESSLLLHGNKDEYVKMNNIFRYVAISIASREESYLVSCESRMKDWPSRWNNRYNDCTAISLFCENITHPTDLLCPKLQLLNLRSSISLPSNFFEGMKELKVVDLERCLPPKSLNVIKKVRTLYLSHMANTSMIGDLKNVEILKIGRWKELPNEVGLLINLRLLDLRDALSLNHIPAGVLSKLSKLEELYVSPGFAKWESRVDGGTTNASLKELESLHMTTLEIGVSNISHLPKRYILENLVNFKIVTMINKRNMKESQKSGNALILTGDASEIVRSRIGAVSKRVEYLSFEKVQNVKDGILGLGDDGFPELKTLQISLCCDTKRLVDETKMKVGCFRMLSEIKISKCTKLEYMFPTSMTARLSQSLESIYIDDCENMEAIFNGKEEGNDVEIANLKEMHLSFLPNLKALWINKYNDQFRDQVVQSYNMEQPNSILFPSSWIVTTNLKKLKLMGCHSLKVVFSTSAASQLRHLQTLQIEDCEKVEYIVGGQEGITNITLIFPMLTKVSFCDLPELLSFCVHNNIFMDWSSLKDIFVSHCPKIETITGAIESPPTVDQKQTLFKIPAEFKEPLKLKYVEVSYCENLMHLFTSLVAKLLVKLEKIIVARNGNMKQVIAKEEGEEEANGITEIIEFPQLRSVTLENLEKMRCFYGGICAMDLESVELHWCSSMKTFSYGSSVCKPKLESICIDNTPYPVIGDLNEKFETVDIGCTEDFTNTSEAVKDLRNIKYLSISNSNTLLNAIPYNSIGSFKNLEKLHVRRCDSMEEIFESGGTSDAVISNIEEISLIFLNKLKHIFYKTPRSIVRCRKLRKLDVFRCDNLKNIFSISSVRDLVQLRELKITNCDGVEQIVAKEEDEITEKIVFPQLTCIEISYFTEGSFGLKCFYSGMYALEFPSLESLSLDRCYNMTTFSTGSLATPVLRQLLVNGNNYPCTEDLNQDLKNKMLEKVYIEKDGNLTRICQIAEESSNRIRELNISYSNIEWCDSMATISSLEKIELHRLENVKCLFNKIPDGFVGFRQLTSLEVGHCKRMENVIPVSMVRGLPQLQHLKISFCHEMEEIITEADNLGEENIVTQKIVMPQLKSISVIYSENLKCFYNGIFDTEFPQLQSLSIEGCYRVETFSNGSVSTPKLQSLQIDSEDYPYSGNLNADFRKTWQLSQDY